MAVCQPIHGDCANSPCRNSLSDAGRSTCAEVRISLTKGAHKVNLDNMVTCPNQCMLVLEVRHVVEE